jgi:acyl carrier protein
VQSNHEEQPVSGQQTIVSVISDILAEQLSLPPDPGACGPDTLLFAGGLDLDSFGIVELISELERQFAFEFQEEDFSEAHFRTVGTLADLVAHYLHLASPS